MKTLKKKSPKAFRVVKGLTLGLLMTDPILAQSNWEHSAVDDEAAVFFDDSYVHEIQLTIDDPNWYNILITLMILMLMAQTRISKLTSQRTVLCLRPRKVRIMLASH